MLGLGGGSRDRGLFGVESKQLDGRNVDILRLLGSIRGRGGLSHGCRLLFGVESKQLDGRNVDVLGLLGFSQNRLGHRFGDRLGHLFGHRFGLRRLEAGQLDGEHARVFGRAGSGGLGLGGCFLGGLGLRRLEARQFDGEHARVFGRVGSRCLGRLDRTVLRPGISDGRERCVRAALGGGLRHGLVRKHRQKLGLVAGQVSLLNVLQ